MIQPHHCLCLQLYRGHGYSEVFSENLEAVLGRLTEKNEKFTVTPVEADILCMACPHFENGICDSDEKVRRLNADVLFHTALPLEKPMVWSDMLSLTEEILSDDEKFALVCGRCEWYTLCSEIRKEGDL